jgi:hypothetical protein
MHFLFKDVVSGDFTNEDLQLFVQLDDVDILSAIKQWQFHEDPILSNLSVRLLRRQLPKIKVQLEPVSEAIVAIYRAQAISLFGVDESLVHHFVKTGELENNAYRTDGGGIRILRKNGEVVDVADASDNYNLSSLMDTVKKHYVTFWEN